MHLMNNLAQEKKTKLAKLKLGYKKNVIDWGIYKNVPKRRK